MNRIIHNRQFTWIMLITLLLILAIGRYFYTTREDHYNFLDEYTTFDTAAGYVHTRQPYHWDFHENKLTDYEYTRAFPHTLYVAAWFKLFGISEVVGKMSSAFLGVLYILSVVYITARIYRDLRVSLLSGVLLLCSSVLATDFRMTRMYSLWYLLMVWVIYLVYRAMTTLKPVYIVGAVAALGVSVMTHVNTLAGGIGMMLFLLVLMICALLYPVRFKKFQKNIYIISGMALVILIIASAVVFMAVPRDVLGGMGGIIGSIAGNLGLPEEPRLGYINMVSRFCGFRTVTCIFCGMAMAGYVAAIVRGLIRRKKADEQRDSEAEIFPLKNEAGLFTLYIFLITASTVVIFTYFLTRYHQDRYMGYVLAPLGILTARGVVLLIDETAALRLRKWLSAAVLGVIVLYAGVWIAYSAEETYHGPKLVYHLKAYEALAKDAAEQGLDPIPIVAFDFRDFYAVQVLDDYETARLPRYGYDKAVAEQGIDCLDEHPEICDEGTILEFAKKHPRGYIIIESYKLGGFDEVIQEFMKHHGVKISGWDVDDTNLEIVKYNLEVPEVYEPEKLCEYEMSLG